MPPNSEPDTEAANALNAKEAKRALRQMLLERRRALSAEQVAAWSAAIAERLWTMPVFRNASSILTFVSSKDNEPDTRRIIAQALEQGRTVLVPVCQPGRQLAWSALHSLAELELTRYGVYEPAPAFHRFAVPGQNSVCITPGLGFDRAGYRVGYAGGYYDRFLSKYVGTSIGVTFDCQLEPTLPIEPHDIAVHFLVTQSRTFVCGPERLAEE